METDNIQAGIILFKSGNKIDARQVFLNIAQHEPDNEVAWLWLAACVDTTEQKRDCFYKILSINPKNQNAQKALAELELQTSSDTKPIPQSGTVLKCPSCGSVMGKPDHTGLIQCSYCGTTITYNPPVEKVEKKNVERYLELCKSALDGKNYNETIQYANKALEIDPGNIDAWVHKAVATFWLSTEANNRYDEAIECLKKAEENAPGDARIRDVFDDLTHRQASWFVYLGNNKVIQGYKIYNEISSLRYYTPLEIAQRDVSALTEQKKYFVDAMNDFLKAAQYLPSDIDILQNIEDLARDSDVNLNNGNKWIYWSDIVNQKIHILHMLRDKPEAERNLPKLRQTLQRVQKDLSVLKEKSSLFNKSKIADAEEEIKRIREQIARYEEIISYNASS